MARTGRYKLLTIASLVLLSFGLFLLTNLHAGTDRPVLWLWMALAGLGIGPSFAVFTLIVQNAVSPDEIGVATASLTFFQQIGGTAGLTLASTAFVNRLASEISGQLAAAGVPQQVIESLPAGAAFDLTGVGDLGQRILASAPAQAQAELAPLIPSIVRGIYEAVSVSIASVFWVGIVAGLVGAACAVLLRETPMRATFQMQPAVASEGGPETASK